MAYFKINDADLSQYVSGLKVSKAANYSSQTNAAGNTVVDYINTKRTLEVTLIPLDDYMIEVLAIALEQFIFSISYREPAEGDLVTMIAILPAHEIDYYTIQANKVLTKPIELTFVEL